MIKKFGLRTVLCTLIGLLLIFTAAGILIVDRVSIKESRQDAEKALQRAEAILQVQDAFPEERSKDYMPTMELEGINVAGIIELPRYQRKLVFRSTWSKSSVYALPCRYTGSVYNGTLVIGADSAKGQFDFAKTMSVKEQILITDMEGSRYSYTVQKIEHSKSASKEKLLSGEWDLTIFVKDSSGYLLIRANVG